jgi:hypothetical protein
MIPSFGNFREIQSIGFLRTEVIVTKGFLASWIGWFFESMMENLEQNMIWHVRELS